MLLGKKGTKEEVADVLMACKELFVNATEEQFTTPDAVKAIVWDYAETRGRGAVLWPLRVALTGREKSPDPFTLGYVLGKNESVARISAVLQSLS
jgi:glutamyl/glutaminyl-tRNA synthetase